MLLRLDTANINADSLFIASLEAILTLDPKHKRANTSMAVAEYYAYSKMGYYKQRRFFKDMLNRPYIDPVVQARILFNLAADLDWNRYYFSPFKIGTKYLFPQMRTYIKKAG